MTVTYQICSWLYTLLKWCDMLIIMLLTAKESNHKDDVDDVGGVHHWWHLD